MERRLWKSLLTFLLVLVLTIGTVAALSMATAGKTELSSARSSGQAAEQQTPAVTEVSAVVREENFPTVASIAAFAMILAVPATGCWLLGRSQKKNREQKKPEKRVSLRSDRTFQSLGSR